MYLKDVVQILVSSSFCLSMSEKFDSNVSTYRSWKDAKEAYIHTLMTQQRNPIF